MPVHRIRTPRDVLEAAAARHSVHEWLSPPFRAEPVLRGAVAELFDRLEALDRDDRGQMAAYAAAGADALAGLEGMGIQVVAVAGPERTRYILANSTCLFRIEQNDVHLLGVDCAAAAREVDAGGPFRWWGDPRLASRAHDDAAPWCPVCRDAAAAEAEA